MLDRLERFLNPLGLDLDIKNLPNLTLILIFTKTIKL